MALPEPVYETLLPIEPASSLIGADIGPFVIVETTLSPEFYDSGDVDPDAPDIGAAPIEGEISVYGHDEPVDNIYRDFFGSQNSTEYEAQDFFTKLDGVPVAIREVGFTIPDINTFLWLNPFTKFSGIVLDAAEDFFGAATAPADEDFFTLLDELGCKVGSTIWDKPLGYTVWDDFGTCWDVPV